MTQEDSNARLPPPTTQEHVSQLIPSVCKQETRRTPTHRCYHRTNHACQLPTRDVPVLTPTPCASAAAVAPSRPAKLHQKPQCRTRPNAPLRLGTSQRCNRTSPSFDRLLGNPSQSPVHATTPASTSSIVSGSGCPCVSGIVMVITPAHHAL